MNYESVLSERARREMVRAWQWYEDRSPGLGDRFIDAFLEKSGKLKPILVKECNAGKITKKQCLRFSPTSLYTE
jgi:hypothetical protein